MLKYGVPALVLLIVAAMAYVRFMPLDAAQLHLDPETADRPKPRGQFMVRPGGDLEPPEFDRPHDAVAAELEQLILATPRTSRLAGDLSAGYASYVTRSGIWGFPDVASVKVQDTGAGRSKVLMLSRQVYGVEDLGVNEARVLSWLEQLKP